MTSPDSNDIPDSISQVMLMELLKRLQSNAAQGSSALPCLPFEKENSPMALTIAILELIRLSAKGTTTCQNLVAAGLMLQMCKTDPDDVVASLPTDASQEVRQGLRDHAIRHNERIKTALEAIATPLSGTIDHHFALIQAKHPLPSDKRDLPGYIMHHLVGDAMLKALGLSVEDLIDAYTS